MYPSKWYTGHMVAVKRPHARDTYMHGALYAYSIGCCDVLAITCHICACEKKTLMPVRHPPLLVPWRVEVSTVTLQCSPEHEPLFGAYWSKSQQKEPSHQSLSIQSSVRPTMEMDTPQTPQKSASSRKRFNPSDECVDAFLTDLHASRRKPTRSATVR